MTSKIEVAHLFSCLRHQPCERADIVHHPEIGPHGVAHAGHVAQLRYQTNPD